MRRRDLDMHNRLDDMKKTIQDINIEVRSQLEMDRSRPGSIKLSANGRTSLPSAGSYNGSDDGVVVSPCGSSGPSFSFTPVTPPARRRRPWSSADNLTDDSPSESGGEDTPDTESIPPLSPLVFDSTSVHSTVSDGTRARLRHSMIVPGEFSVPDIMRGRSRSNEFTTPPPGDMRSRASTVTVTPVRRKVSSRSGSSENSQKKGKSWMSSLFRRITSSEGRKSRRSLDNGKDLTRTNLEPHGDKAFVNISGGQK